MSYAPITPMRFCFYFYLFKNEYFLRDFRLTCTQKRPPKTRTGENGGFWKRSLKWNLLKRIFLKKRSVSSAWIGETEAFENGDEKSVL